MEQIIQTAHELGMNLRHHPSGGASDGNKLAAAGLPVVDTLGPVGGNLHSAQEYVKLPTLLERARLAARVLHKLAARQIDAALQ
jgi:glutamate carboxypeptidase